MAMYYKTWKHFVVCAQPHFLTDSFWNFVWRCILVKSTHLYILIMRCPPVSIYIVSKVMFVMCPQTAAFLDRFLRNFVWRCNLVKSTHLYIFIMCCPPLFQFIYCQRSYLLCVHYQLHFLTDFFEILYEGVSW